MGEFDSIKFVSLMIENDGVEIRIRLVAHIVQVVFKVDHVVLHKVVGSVG